MMCTTKEYSIGEQFALSLLQSIDFYTYNDDDNEKPSQK